MPDYDFHQLSPCDLELLARDLLQAHWAVQIESFKSGKDRGIDLRYAAGTNALSALSPALPAASVSSGAVSGSPVPTREARIRRWRTALIGVVAFLAVVQVTGAAALTLIPVKTEEFTIHGADPGITLYLRNKHLEIGDHFRGTVLFVHGGTYPGESFDVIFDGVDCPDTKPRAKSLSFWDRLWRRQPDESETDYAGITWRSWLDYHALSGFDVYFVDVRGYGRSTKPPEMDEPADKNPPVARTDVAERDLAATVDFILKRRNVQRLDLIGSAWGSVLAATYAVQHPEHVERLVLQSPIWLHDMPVVQVSLPAYRVMTREEARQRWFDGVPEKRKADLIPCGWFDRWADRIWATDPEGGTHTPPIVRVPNGALLDDQVYWSAGKPLYNPAGIVAPVLLVRGEWDRASTKHMTWNLFERLVNARSKRRVVIPEGTQMLMVEKNRLKLYREVERFLEEQDVPAAVSRTPD